MDFPGSASGKEPTRHKGDMRLRFDPSAGKSPGGEMATHSSISCLENPMDRGAWPATVQRVTKS